jgi:hypothetical protein
MTRTRNPNPPGKVAYMRIPEEMHIRAERIAIAEDRTLHSVLRALIWEGLSLREGRRMPEKVTPTLNSAGQI